MGETDSRGGESRLLRIALRAYPKEVRERDGAVLLDCAAELAGDGGSRLREAAGLARGGLARRAGIARGDFGAVPWGAATERLAVPLAAASLAVWGAGALRFWGLAPLGRWWALLLAGAVTALLGALTRDRRLAGTGWALTAAVMAFALVTGELDQQGSRFEVTFGTVAVDMVAAFFPLVLLGAATTIRLGGARRADDLHWVAAALAVIALASGDPLGPTGPAGALLVGGLLGAPILVAVAARGRPVRLAVAAMLGAIAAPEAVWLALYPAPYPGPQGALAMLVGLGLAAGLVVIAVARRAGAGARRAG